MSPVPPAMPRVSVVMIFLDGREFIAAAIDSVLAQTIADWELILVDDGSTDGSSEVARRYASDHPQRIRYLEHAGHANRGTGISRNTGIAASRAGYIAFLDADDEYLPARLERHLQAFAAHPELGMVVSNSLFWHSWSDAHRVPDQVIGHWQPANVPLSPPELLAMILCSRKLPMPSPCGITFRREVALAAGGIPPQFTDQYEDQVLICQLMLAAPVLALDECLARYRQHERSLTARARSSGAYRPGRVHQARFVFLSWLQEAVRRRGVAHPRLERGLRRQLWPWRHPRLNAVYEWLRDGLHRGHLALRGVRGK